MEAMKVQGQRAFSLGMMVVIIIDVLITPDLFMQLSHTVIAAILYKAPDWTIASGLLTLEVLGQLYIRANHPYLQMTWVSGIVLVMGCLLLPLQLIHCACIEGDDDDEKKESNKRE